jgi:hypothetical protein
MIIDNTKYKISCDIRSLISHIFAKRGYNKNSKTEQILGISFEDLNIYLIDGCIKRYGYFDSTIQYHIDHIIPISSASSEEEILKLNHYSNLQLLTAEDNLKKGSNFYWI